MRMLQFTTLFLECELYLSDGKHEGISIFAILESLLQNGWSEDGQGHAATGPILLYNYHEKKDAFIRDTFETGWS